MQVVQGMKKYYLAMAILAVVGIVAAVWQYTLSRGTASDQKKIADISDIQGDLESYYYDNDKLPGSLDELNPNGEVKSRLSDYEYSKTDNSYTLCANFKTDASNDDYGDDSPYFHGKGRQCFTQEVIDTNYNTDELYPEADPYSTDSQYY